MRIRGSSPLARGLRLHGVVLPHVERIIPARAGFTAPAACGDQRPKDHPRSRGVYHGRVDHVPDEGGSSPLARGLPECGPPGGPKPGIIPARAGFTGMPCGARSAASDHPRSRGVYVLVYDPYEENHGSSPLARGLLHERIHRDADKGIIPARAGFTSASPWVAPNSPGSSPLARGLPSQIKVRDGELRIIPARAGFTRASPWTDPPTPDHPRSRGVYDAGRAAHSTHDGSSPLARGLRSAARRASRCAGIIPARAGFTEICEPTTFSVSDHPRSRGVYSRGGRRHRHPSGSSPLARGLRCHADGRRVEGRIIPARAGFTRRDIRRDRTGTDHPRSRGVYAICDHQIRQVAGSSPLARGLLRFRRSGSSFRGIIPARAGFTLSIPQIFVGPKDHPRSRGVYSE